jgi:hypothetical protein
MARDEKNRAFRFKTNLAAPRIPAARADMHLSEFQRAACGPTQFRGNVMIRPRRLVQLSCVLAAVTVFRLTLAADTYTCQTADVPGTTNTQLWRLNNQGQVAASTAAGGYIYQASTGTWTPLPAPPAATGYVANDVSAEDINDSGTIVGTATNASVLAQGFILGSVTNPTTYQFVPLYAGATPVFTYEEFRGISDNGLVTAFAQNANGAVGLIYNPTASSIGIFPTGYTPFVPTLSDGSMSIYTITGGMNTAGLLVGSELEASGTVSEQGFLYNAATQATYPVALSSANLALRGVNDSDPNSTANCGGATNCIRLSGWGITLSSGNQFPFWVDYNSTSGMQALQVVDCTSTLPVGANQILFEGINNDDVATGFYQDAVGIFHGLVAYPNVTTPGAIVHGAFIFDIPVLAGVPIFIDPEIAAGYEYAIREGDPKFQSVTLPIGIGANNSYTLIVHGRAFSLPAGQRFDFTRSGSPDGVHAFTVLGIDPGAALSTTNTTAFVTEVSFVAAGQFTGSMRPLTAAAEIRDLERATDRDGHRLEHLIREIAKEDIAGDTSAACRALGEFVADVAASSFRLGPIRTNDLTAQALAIENALSCP